MANQHLCRLAALLPCRCVEGWLQIVVDHCERTGASTLLVEAFSAAKPGLHKLLVSLGPSGVSRRARKLLGRIALAYVLCVCHPSRLFDALDDKPLAELHHAGWTVVKAGFSDETAGDDTEAPVLWLSTGNDGGLDAFQPDLSSGPKHVNRPKLWLTAVRRTAACGPLWAACLQLADGW